MRSVGRLLLQAVPTLLGVMTVLFLLIRMIPGDPAQVMLGTDATAADLARLRHDLGLDRSLLTQYVIFLRDFVTGNWGLSLATHEPVVGRILEVLPSTLLLCAASIVVIIAISIPAGVISAVKRNTALDYGVSVTVFLLMSMPQFWLGLILLLVFSYWLGWLPIYGNGEPGDMLDQAVHLILPAVTLAAGFLGLTTRLTRSSMLEVLSRDYIRTARAKGLSESVVIVRHALRNALLSVVTVLGLTVGQLLGGAVIVEVVFGRTGAGTMVWDAILQRDYPQVQASVAVFAGLFILTTLLTDMLYTVLNPRIRL
ncbi:ABC transporter permease [Bradyrhizobium sp. U87765 SZCCT0131]|uniref:ABC transporter permease n=1 Tax=unclassified Bradyrhizobium TaxID=2631580 RepID=UPI001BADD31F|nr:ABC transporter permease [Bradyrhizobium sp. U87765 SZCCT0131]MBR1264681.1 ABC transporter permease [Bradyrhizobium sp. U87765 SZCCT0134]MBR1304413.1 ABC transporter permease [Bradyrhizobium sp. U87765 SZCCT0110]MBR1322730.1 ABC transporter permease [Bradyrhizobium sp. U87765 SZCCT0109]MBR1346342.1 ABC transporter permease [Bradyrhizobium sp. U87765 SZCCT0048]